MTSKNLTPEAVIRFRLDEKNTPTRKDTERKWANLRDIAAGNLDALYDWMGNSMYALDTDRQAVNESADFWTKENIDIRNVIEGRINMLQRSVKSIVQQTSMVMPTFEFEGLEMESLVFHRQYFEDSWGPAPLGCDALSQMDRVKWDFLTLGIGFPGVTLRRGVPVVRRFDPMNVLFDNSGNSTEEMQWCAIWEKRRASEWITVFDDHAHLFEDALETDRLVEVVFYYDVYGDSGTTAAYLSEGGEIGAQLDYSETWSRVSVPINDEDRLDMAFLPVYPLTYLEPAGYANPVGLVELLAPLQVAIAKAYHSIQRNASFPHLRMMRQEALDTETRQKLSEGIVPNVFFVNPEIATPLSDIGLVLPAPGVDPNLSVLIEKWEQMFTEVNDDNPYSGGQSQNVEFAREVNAIQAASGKGMSYIIKRIAKALEVLAQRFLYMAYEFDDVPRVIKHDGLLLECSGENAVKYLLDPHARIMVREDDLRYMSRAERIQLAEAKRSMLMEYVQLLGPQVAIKGLKDSLKAMGVDDIDGYLQPDQDEQANMLASQSTQNPQAAFSS